MEKLSIEAKKAQVKRLIHVNESETWPVIGKIYYRFHNVVWSGRRCFNSEVTAEYAKGNVEAYVIFINGVVKKDSQTLEEEMSEYGRIINEEHVEEVEYKKPQLFSLYRVLFNKAEKIFKK